MSRAWRRFARNRGAVVGAVIVLALLATAALAPSFTARDPLAADVDHGLTALGAPLPASSAAPLGTDPLGRDEWARIAAGAASSLSIAGLATLIALGLGLGVGLVAGYAGGAVDQLLMRAVDLMLALPFVLVAILLAAVLRSSALASAHAPVYLTLGALGWMPLARVIRGKARGLMASEMITAARTLGASPARIIARHLLPNLAGLALSVAVFGLAQNLLAEAVLSYVGLGPPPPAASWGHMLYEGRAYYRIAPHLVAAPGLAILAAVAGFHLLGDGLRDALDPRDASR
ncbi:MAG TPA: ABC transporter permease [Kofleriaceae bacterium]